MAHGQRGVAVIQISGTRKQELEVVVELSHGAHRGARGAHGVGLVNGYGSGHTVYTVYRWFVHAVHKLAGVSRKCFDIAALPLGKERVKHQTRFTRTTRTCDYRELPRANV